MLFRWLREEARHTRASPFRSLTCPIAKQKVRGTGSTITCSPLCPLPLDPPDPDLRSDPRHGLLSCVVLLMAIRLNTILVVLSVPTLLSAAVTILWRRKRNASKSATATTTTTTADTTDTPSTATIAETATTEKTEIQVSETVTRDIIPEPQSYPAARQPQSQQQVQCETVIPVMQITDGADLTQTPPTAVPDQPARTATTTAAAANGADATTDLSPKVEKDPVLKSKGKKQPPQQTEWKKSGSAKKEKMLSGSSDQKGKNLTNGQSPASDAHSPAAAVPGSEPDSRSRKTHDSGNSLDSGADVMSPASSAGAADPKSSDRSVDSPGLFKSDASQGSPCNWGTSDSHSEVCSDLPDPFHDSLLDSVSPLPETGIQRQWKRQ